MNTIKKHQEQFQDIKDKNDYIGICNENIETINELKLIISGFFGILEKYKNEKFSEIMNKNNLIKKSEGDIIINVGNSYKQVIDFIMLEKSFFESYFNNNYYGLILKEFLSFFGKEENYNSDFFSFIDSLELDFEKKIKLKSENLYKILQDELLGILYLKNQELEEEVYSTQNEIEFVKKYTENILNPEERISYLENKKIEELNELKNSIFLLFTLFQENNEDNILYLDRLGINNLINHILDILETNSTLFDKNVYSSYFYQLLEYFSIKKEYNGAKGLDMSNNNFTKSFNDFNNFFCKNLKKLLNVKELEGKDKKILEEDLSYLEYDTEKFISRVMSYFEVGINDNIKSLKN